MNYYFGLSAWLAVAVMLGCCFVSIFRWAIRFYRKNKRFGELMEWHYYVIMNMHVLTNLEYKAALSDPNGAITEKCMKMRRSIQPGDISPAMERAVLKIFRSRHIRKPNGLD